MFVVINYLQSLVKQYLILDSTVLSNTFHYMTGTELGLLFDLQPGRNLKYTKIVLSLHKTAQGTFY